jgi:NADH dehydrogenase
VPRAAAPARAGGPLRTVQRAARRAIRRAPFGRGPLQRRCGRRGRPELKSLGGALDIRSRILSAFSAADLEDDDQRQRDWLTFLIVGGGPTGVEMAGQIAELAHDAFRRDFRRADPGRARVLLVETTDRVLPAVPSKLSTKAAQALQHLGVTPLVGHTVVDIGPDSVTIR